ncbi:hypothetical protein K7432_016712 [Basidiobolus ranarum]|uniref:Uncharacterized protein n=1 Tax=Basidiobolus ranarum TaxID=34480 RepID=A0ABR2WEB7_9FUNG
MSQYSPFPTNSEDSFVRESKCHQSTTNKSTEEQPWQEFYNQDTSKGIQWKLESDQEKHIKRLEILHARAKNSPKTANFESEEEDEASYVSQNSTEDASPDANEVVAVDEGLWLLWKQKQPQYPPSEDEPTNIKSALISPVNVEPTPIYKTEGQFLSWIDRIGLACCFGSYSE